MGATQYEVLYRYTNPNSNQFIKNDTETKYKPVFELYHNDHKIVKGTTDEILEANNEKSQLIVDGNNTDNDNYGMLFKFSGTKRKNKKKWIPITTGYVIRDKEAVRDKITRAVDGDFSGDYLLIEGTTIENGVVVAKKNPVTTPIIISDNFLAKNKKFFENEDELFNVLINSTIASLNLTTLDKVGTLDEFSNKAQTFSGFCEINIKIGYDFQTQDKIAYRYDDYSTISTIVMKALMESAYKVVLDKGGQGFSRMTISPSTVKTYQIPAHYEEVPEFPYVVCDTYERIEQSPWFTLVRTASLPAAIEKAEKAVKSLGLENVKLIKVVPTEQSVKLR